MIKKNYLLICALCVSCFVFAQPPRLSKNHPVAVAAPHLPAIIRYNGVGQKFYGEKNVYNADQNNAKLKGWMKAYSGELAKYKVAISKYLESTDESKLSTKEAELYYDLKTQWMMIRQQPGFYNNEATLQTNLKMKQ